MTLPEQVSAAFKIFTVAQNKTQDFGSHDTEPESEMQYYVASSLCLYKPRRLPEGRDWELYSSTPGHMKAARTLTSAVKKVVKELKKLNLADPVVRQCIQNHLWRVF